MEVSGAGGGGGSSSVGSSSGTKSSQESQPAEAAAPVKESSAPESPTAETAPQAESVGSLDVDPVETVSDPSASKDLVEEQASVAEELGGGESTFPDDDDEAPALVGEESETGAAEEAQVTGEEATEVDESAAPPEEIDETADEAAAVGEGGAVAAEAPVEAAEVPQEEAMAALDAQLSAAGLPPLDPAHRPESVDVVVTPVEGGGQKTVQTFQDATGAFSGTFQVITDADGQVTGRTYESTLVREFPTTKPAYDENGQETGQTAKELDITSQTIEEVLQPDGTFARTGTMTHVSQEPPDFAGYYNRTTISGEYGGPGEISYEYVGPDGEVINQNKQVVNGPPGEPPALPEEGPFTQTEQLVHLPDGSTRLETRITDDIAGYAGGQSVLIDPQGRPATRTAVVETPHLPGGVSGISFMKNLGITGAINILEDNIGPDPDYLSRTVTVEQFDQNGDVSGRARTQEHTWTSQDGNNTLTMIDRGRELPREYVLTKTEDERVSTQNFIEGSEDTMTSVEETDENGFRVVTVEADASDAAGALVEKGEQAQESFAGETRMKENANLTDLQAVLGSQYDTLLGNDPEFAALVNQLGDQTFSLLDLQTSSTMIGPGGFQQEVNSRGVSINIDGQTHILVTEGENTGLKLVQSGETPASFDEFGALTKSAGIAAGSVSTIMSAGKTAKAFEDLVIEGVGDLRHLTRVTRTAGALREGGPMAVAGLLGDTVAAIAAFSNNDIHGGLLSSGSVGADLGGMAPSYSALARSTASLEAKTVGYAARSLGVAGSLLIAGTGAYDLFVNNNIRGAFDMTAGLGGTGYLLTAGSGGALGLLGAASGVIGGVAVVGGLVYDYSDSHRLAPQRI